MTGCENSERAADGRTRICLQVNGVLTVTEPAHREDDWVARLERFLGLEPPRRERLEFSILTWTPDERTAGDLPKRFKLWRQLGVPLTPRRGLWDRDEGGVERSPRNYCLNYAVAP